MVVEKRRQKVIGGCDRMKITREMEIQILHRHHLGIAAAGRAAFDAEARPKGRFAQSQHGLLSKTV